MKTRFAVCCKMVIPFVKENLLFGAIIWVNKEYSVIGKFHIVFKLVQINVNISHFTITCGLLDLIAH